MAIYIGGTQLAVRSGPKSYHMAGKNANRKVVHVLKRTPDEEPLTTDTQDKPTEPLTTDTM